MRSRKSCESGGESLESGIDRGKESLASQIPFPFQHHMFHESRSDSRSVSGDPHEHFGKNSRNRESVVVKRRVKWSCSEKKTGNPLKLCAR